MGLVRDLALFNLANPDKVSPEMKNALYGRWIHDMTTKKESFGDKLKGAVKGLLTGNMMGFSTGLVTNPKQTLQTYGNMISGKSAGAASSTSMLPETTTTIKKGKKLTQLRQAKGGAGGGSYTEAVKNPLGGSAGKTGK